MVVPSDRRCRVLSCELGLQTVDDCKALMTSILDVVEVFTPEEITEYTQIAIQAKNMTNTIRQPDIKDLKTILETSMAASCDISLVKKERENK